MDSPQTYPTQTLETDEYAIKTKRKDNRIPILRFVYGQLTEPIGHLFYHEEMSFREVLRILRCLWSTLVEKRREEEQPINRRLCGYEWRDRSPSSKMIQQKK
ncbi:MAG: hypothetical protein ACYDCP_07360 [Thermoplasmataceae archaeon]